MNRKLQKIRKECLQIKKQLDKKQTEFEEELEKFHGEDDWMDREIDSASLSYDLLDDSTKMHFESMRKASGG